MAAKLNLAVTMAAVFAAAAALPSDYAVAAFEGEDGPPRPEHHYAAKSYHFQYAVHDPVTGDEKSHNEVSDGRGTVTGAYTVVEADGSKRVVEYTADDEHGFRAEVKKIGPPRSREPAAASYALEKLEHQQHTPVHGARYHYVPESYPSH